MTMVTMLLRLLLMIITTLDVDSHFCTAHAGFIHRMLSDPEVPIFSLQRQPIVSIVDFILFNSRGGLY